MSLHEVDGQTRSWDRPLAGSLDLLVVRSEALADNPLGDPALRPLYVYRPPGFKAAAGDGARLSAVYMLQGFGGRLEEWLAPDSDGLTTVERLDSMFAAGESPPALIVFVDAWTSRGGSQFLNSTSTGRYLDYVCDEVVPFVDVRYPTLAAREHRGVSGKSSGGYGALVLSMLRPDLFGALASHAGDALFECCYRPLFPAAARMLRDEFGGSWDAFEQQIEAPDFDWRECPVLFAAYGTACAFTPDPGRPGRALIPFDSLTGRPIDDLWTRWRRWIRCGWPRSTSRRSPACAGSTSLPAARTSSSWTSGRWRCRASSRASRSSTRSSCSMATTTGSTGGCRRRSAS